MAYKRSDRSGKRNQSWMLHAAHCAYAGLRCDTLPLLSASTCTGVCTCKLLLPPACCLIVFFFVTAGCAANLPSGFSICWLSLYQTQFANSRISQEKKSSLACQSMEKSPFTVFCLFHYSEGVCCTIRDGVWWVNSARSVTTQLLLFMDI